MGSHNLRDTTIWPMQQTCRKWSLCKVRPEALWKAQTLCTSTNSILLLGLYKESPKVLLKCKSFIS